MRLLLVNNLFQPEPNHLKGLDFAKALVRRGHEVEVLTVFPSYPGGCVYPGYRMRWTTRETLEGIRVTRVAMYPSHDRSGARRIFSYASIGLSQALHALALGRRFDLCHVYLGPITLVWPALVLRRLHGTRFVADVQDLWPESVNDSGMLRSPAAARLLAAVCRRSHTAADRLIALSPGYGRALEAQGVAPERIDVVYNWCDESALQEAGPPCEVHTPARPLRVLYAGNLGKLQGLDTVLDAAARLAGRSGATIHLLGDGVEAERLRRRVREERLGNVTFGGRVTAAEASAQLRAADLLLVHLLPTPLTRIGIPQKVQAYLAAGRPVLLAGEGDAAELVRRSGGGVVCPPGSSAALTEAICAIEAMSPQARAALGAAGRCFYMEELAFERGVDRIEEVFRRALSSPATGAVAA